MKDLLEKGAVLQRDKETYAIAPHIPAGLVTSDNLENLLMLQINIMFLQ